MLYHSSILHDVIVIGAGAAGLSAGLWCDELGFKTLVLEQADEIGGQLLRIYNAVENHLGAENARNGRELRDRFAAQLAGRGFLLQTEVAVSAVDFTASETKRVFLKNGKDFSAKFLILATGVRRRKLGVPGENEFAGRGLLASGQRDRALVAGKTVVVVGGGDAAAENALILSATAAKVYLIHRRREFRARAEFLEKINQTPKIEVLSETKVLEIVGDERISAVKLERNQSSEPFQIETDAVLLRIGVEPNSEIFRAHLKTDPDGYLEINGRCETNVAGVFAIGDVASPLAPTISSAVGMGATAPKSLLLDSHIQFKKYHFIVPKRLKPECLR